jgi:hypothetical protein
MRFVVDLSCAVVVGTLASACFETSQPDLTARDDAGTDAATGSPGRRDGGEPDSGPGSQEGIGRIDGGNDSGIAAFVSFALAPDRDCIYSGDPGSVFVPVGAYDIGASMSAGCAQPYLVHLLLTISAGPEVMVSDTVPNVLQVTSAEVELMSRERRPIAFDRGDSLLPNPFLVTASSLLPFAPDAGGESGVVAIEAIPTEYARQLDVFVGGQILAEIRVHGTTFADVDVEFEPFVYPIELCSGCLSICKSQLDAMGRTRRDVVGDQCDDNAGADGRICIDVDC